MTTLNIATTLDYGLGGPTDLILAVEAAPLPDQTIGQAHIEVPPGEHFARVKADDAIGERILLRLSGGLKLDYTSTITVERPDHDLTTLKATPVHLLPGEAVRYLMASRFCPSDRFQPFVLSEFGGLFGGTAVAAMVDWVKDRMTYAPGSSGPQTTALESFVERQGVCRDFAHLVITFARAASIPARMASVYAPDVEPQDFHAVAQVWLDGAWRLVDATLMAKPSETAIICVGRDAADVAFLTSYGRAILRRQQIQVTRA